MAFKTAKLSNKEIISRVVELVEKKAEKFKVRLNDTFRKVKNIIEKHSKLESDLSSTDIDKKFAEMSKEYSDISEIIDDAKFILCLRLKKELEKIINDKSSDKEMIDLAILNYQN